jgi:hypothetical protein
MPGRDAVPLEVRLGSADLTSLKRRWCVVFGRVPPDLPSACLARFCSASWPTASKPMRQATSTLLS